MTCEILCTLGPASMNERVISRLEHLGASMFRVNLSHTKLEDVDRVIRFIQSHTKVPVCLDTEGAQIRTTSFVDGQITLRENTLVTLHAHLVPGDAYNIGFYPPCALAELRAGDFISIDFNAVLVQVVEPGAQRTVVRIISGGQIGSNKAVTVHRPITLPVLTDKDRSAIAIGLGLGISHVALSFANRAEDVDEVRSLAKDAFIISKIECRNGLDNLRAITERTDAILIDRGDLSREIPIERIPAAQKYIIRTAKEIGRKVYVATNLLESMVSSPLPTRAEVNDIFNTLQDGADGLVLAAETAVGKYPINCAAMVVKLGREYRSGITGLPSLEGFSLLPEPHGGHLNISLASSNDLMEISGLQRLILPEESLRDAQQIALGVYSPLTGFMCRLEIEDVLSNHRLPNGHVWTMPIILQIPAEAKNVSKGDRVALYSASGHCHSLLDVSEVFQVDLHQLASRWFGTESADHPGVARLLSNGSVLAAGAVRLVEPLKSSWQAYELTPEQCRFIFGQKGWTRVVGFNGSSVPHRVHEHIQLTALESTLADGLFISPDIGANKSGNFSPRAILKAYEILLEFGVYPKDRAVLGALASYPRYSGPREAVFKALCHKNLGCSHFIISPGSADFGNFYNFDDTRRLFERLNNLGIEPVFFDSIGWDTLSSSYTNAPQALSLGIDEIREALKSGLPVPDWSIRPIVQDALRAEIASGQEIFQL
ncbi:MAG: sulfate adenylyltransferase [Alphaproteobacteria bacterium]|nr:sulfate adenylyltransferase [Alphaproteobacteria bacterium]